MEKLSESEGTQPTKTLIILSKPQTDRQSQSGDSGVPQSPNKNIEMKPPTVLLKTREGSDRDTSRSCSPGVSSPSSNQSFLERTKESEGTASTLTQNNNSQPVYHIQQKTSLSSHSTVEVGNDQKLCPSLEMNSPVKLVDESLQWCDNAMEFLQDQTDFYVIGVVGLQGSGKSTVLSILSGHYGQDGGKMLFKHQTREHKELGEHCTVGIDVYVTSERVILLDTQPILSASVMDQIIQYEKKIPGGTDYHSTENALQMQSLQIIAFLMAVCHTIILVQDWFVDPNLLRFIQSAEMLKPATPTNPHEGTPAPEENTEYYPHIVFVQNKCQRADYSPSCLIEMQELLSLIFQKSKLKQAGHVCMEFFSKKYYQSSVNLFLIPEIGEEQGNGEEIITEYSGHPGFESLANSFIRQVLSMPRSLLTHTALSEKNWFHYAARIWETVKKSSLFLEYSRLLP
ncbi:protein SMG9-like [Centruroides sculpturatus]|uniref:protein SMG9-like n=1 Tax=Centruroides sculpturatus TaxID=218467 RepID=UPI000C6EBB51|nr:protein SMG9-like [Centruroides sculpturatus]